MSVPVLRAGSVALVLFGALVTTSAVIRLVADDGGSSAVAAWPGLIGAVFGILGLSGLAMALGDHLRRWALVAFVAATVGLAFSVGQLYGLTFATPGEGPLGPLFPLGYGPFLFGFLLLDVLLLMSREVPRAAPLALIAGAALNAAGFATPEVRLVGVVVFGVGIALLGSSVVARSRQSLVTPAGHALPQEGAAHHRRDGDPSMAV